MPCVVIQESTPITHREVGCAPSFVWHWWIQNDPVGASVGYNALNDGIKFLFDGLERADVGEVLLWLKVRGGSLSGRTTRLIELFSSREAFQRLPVDLSQLRHLPI